MEPYYGNGKDSLFLCPMATKPYIGRPEQLPTDLGIEALTQKRYWALAYIGAGPEDWPAWMRSFKDY